MDYRLLYTQRALNDLAEIIGHIAEDDADAASAGARCLEAKKKQVPHRAFGPIWNDKLFWARFGTTMLGTAQLESFAE